MASGAAVRPRQGFDFMKNRAFYSLNNKLSYPITSPEVHRMLGIGVQQDHLDLATVPRVDGARRIDDGDAVPRGQAGSRMHERGVPIRERDAHAGADDSSLPGGQVKVGSCEQVGAGITRMGSLRQRQAGVQAPDQYRDRPRLGARAGHPNFLWSVAPASLTGAWRNLVGGWGSRAFPQLRPGVPDR